MGINSAISVDSIHFLLAHEKNDTVKVRLFNTLADKYLHLQKNDSVLWYAQQGLNLSLKTHYLKGEFESRKWWPIVLRETGDYPNALKLALQNLQVAETINDPFILLIGLHGVARTYSEMGDLINQIKYNRRSEEIINSGYFKDENDVKFKRLSFYLVMMAGAFEKLNQLDSAIHYMRTARGTALYLNIPESLALTSENLGRVFLKMGKYDSSLFYYKMILPYIEKLPHRYDLKGEAQLGLAKVFRHGNALDSAIYYSKLSLNTCRNINYSLGELDAATFLNEIYSGQNRMDSAYKYLTLTYTLKDSLYNLNRTKQIEEIKYNEALKRQQMAQERKEAQQSFETKLKLYGLVVGLGILFLISFSLYRNNKQKQKANALLQEEKEKVESTLSELKSTQAQLIQSEKMASLGQLTAGIAHEIQNPLNFVNNFSELSSELMAEMKDEFQKGNMEDAFIIVNDLEQNLGKINHHGKRAGAIVRSMLEHSKLSNGKAELSDINALADEYLRLAYHGARTKDDTFNVITKTDFDSSIGKINIIPQDIGRVLLNLYNNAFYAVNEKNNQKREGYEPIVSVCTKKLGDKIEISVADNGNGIPAKIIDKIFQPFFTTKPTGQGTGLGLSLSYDIIKAHGGEIKIKTKEGEGSVFVVLLPFV